MKIRKRSPVSKENALTSAAQTAMKAQDEIVAKLTARIANLEKTVESKLVITKNVNDILTNEVDDLQQYQRCQCMVTDGLQAAPKKTMSEVTQKVENVLAQHLKLDPNKVVNQIDNCQRIGLLKDDGTQSTTVRFKPHSFREKIYINRKKSTNRYLLKGGRPETILNHLKPAIL